MSQHNFDKKALERAKEQLDAALQEILDKGIIDSPLVEARPAWFKPDEIVIGQLRDQGDQSGFFWIIGGNLPVDYLHNRSASTPREAAKHFAVKWQLDAARIEDPELRKELGVNPELDWDAYAKTLIGHAEYLYSIAEDDSLWR